MSTLTGKLQRKVKKSSKKPLQWLRRAAFKERPVVNGPFGERDTTPCDFYSSGGSLKIVDKFVEEMIGPQLDKTHDGLILGKKKLSDIREEARRFIHKATNCSEDHVVTFTDSLNFVDVFLSYMNALDVPRLCESGRRPPIILIGHDLWTTMNLEVRKLGADASEIPAAANGHYDLRKLDALLKFYSAQGRLLIGAFSAGDDVTGALSDIQQMTALLHAHGSLVVWDYSTAGAYVKINMCPLVSYEGLTHKDAAFIRTDRFLGGTGGSAVFITTYTMLRNPIFETVIEGIISISCVEGSLEYSLSSATDDRELLSRNTERRLACGPFRARCAFELKGYFGDCYLQKRTLEVSEKLTCGFFNREAIHVIGGRSNRESLPFVSLLLFHHHTEWALHHGFAAALLHDLFGISALLHPIKVGHLPPIPELESQRFMHSILSQDTNLLFPSQKIMHVGCLHISLMYFMRDIELEFLSAAINIVSEEGWRLMPFYRFNAATAKWMCPYNLVNKTERMGSALAKLRSIQSTAQSVRYRHVVYLERARKILDSISSRTIKKTLKDEPAQGDELLSEQAKKMRWFMTPADAAELLDDASPVRISKANGSDRGERRRTWPGSSGQPRGNRGNHVLNQLSIRRRN